MRPATTALGFAVAIFIFLILAPVFSAVFSTFAQVSAALGN